jgi:hypothetical protein
MTATQNLYLALGFMAISNEVSQTAFEVLYGDRSL